MILPAAILLIAAHAVPQSAAVQFGLSIGLIDGAVLACHMPGRETASMAAEEIQRLAASKADGDAAVRAYAKSFTEIAGWLLDKNTDPQVCASFDALIRMLHELAGIKEK